MMLTASMRLSNRLAPAANPSATSPQATVNAFDASR